MLADELLQATMINALPFMHQTSNVITDTNPHLARILQNTQNIRQILALPTGSEVNELTSIFNHEADAPCSSSSSSHNGWTPSSSEASTTAPTPELNLPVGSNSSCGDSNLNGPDSSSMVQGQMTRLSFHPATSSSGIRIEHPGAEVLWQHLTDAVNAARTLPSKYRRFTTTMDQCLRDVILAERMPDQLLKILPQDFEVVLMTEGSNTAQQALDDLDLRLEEDASNCEDYTMERLESKLPELCAALHWYIAESVLKQTIARFGGILALVLQDQNYIEEIVYVWLDFSINIRIIIADTRIEQNFCQRISEATKRYVVPLLLLGACREYKSAEESHERLHACLDFFLLDHRENMLAPENQVLLPKDWTESALEALAYGVSRYAVYMRSVAQQAAVNLQRDGDCETVGDAETEGDAERDGESENDGELEGV